jgi:hypothetical protein
VGVRKYRDKKGDKEERLITSPKSKKSKSSRNIEASRINHDCKKKMVLTLSLNRVFGLD